MFCIITLLRSWQLYTEAAIGTLGRHLVQHSSSVTQKQCLNQQSMYFAHGLIRLPTQALKEVVFSCILLLPENTATTGPRVGSCFKQPLKLQRRVVA